MKELIIIGKIYEIFLLFFLGIYMIRHFTFTINRLYGYQRQYYHDIIDDELPNITVIIPMHNEELVADKIFNRLIQSDYPREMMEVVAINDHSSDKTAEIIDYYANQYNWITAYHRLDDNQQRGKVHGLNEVMGFAKGEIVIVFDADYVPSKWLLRALTAGFKDPEIGAVMGRVLVGNTRTNLLTALLDMERSGGYQVGQQARYNLDLIPQYGGTVGAYRKSVVQDMGGFDPSILAEDTELTYNMFLHGWKVAYANKAECYEEAPESWEVRSKQIRRWSRGHNQVMFRYFLPTIRSKYLNFSQKFDAILLLMVYVIPFFLGIGFIDSFFLYLVGDITLVNSILLLLGIMAANAFGNFAPFFQVGIATYLDGRSKALNLLPLFSFNFVLYLYYTSAGFFDAMIDIVTKRNVEWVKTVRSGKQDYANT